MKEVVLKMARQRGSYTGQSRRRWVRFCRSCLSRKRLVILEDARFPSSYDTVLNKRTSYTRTTAPTHHSATQSAPTSPRNSQLRHPSFRHPLPRAPT